MTITERKQPPVASLVTSQGGQTGVVQMFEEGKEIHLREEFPPRGSVLVELR